MRIGLASRSGSTPAPGQGFFVGFGVVLAGLPDALGAYFVLFPRARVTSLVFLGFFYQLIDVPAIIVLGFWFVLQLISGLASLGATEAGGVAVFAHIGGFVVGAVITRLLMVVRPRMGGSARPSTVG
jgi:membrane associated rhomboid family serine protease